MALYRERIINPDTFEPGDEVRSQPHKNYPDGIVLANGTVEVTLHGFTKRLPAHRRENGDISVRGLFGRYRTSAMSWPATVINQAGGTYVHFGRDDRSPRFQKINGLHFA